MHSLGDHTAIELKGPDRTGLLSEIFAVLAELECNVMAAEVWTHRTRVACVVYVNDVATGQAIDDAPRMSRIEERLRQVLRGYGGDDGGGGAHTNFSVGSTHVDRRLHQLMHADMEFDEGGPTQSAGGDGDAGDGTAAVTVEHCEEKAYSVVNVRCRDRPKLLFDIVCTLTDMQYVVFHAAVTSDGVYGVQVYICSTRHVTRKIQSWRCRVRKAFPFSLMMDQEMYIRRKDGRTLLKDEAEKVIKCLEAAISRRVSEVRDTTKVSSILVMFLNSD